MHARVVREAGLYSAQLVACDLLMRIIRNAQVDVAMAGANKMGNNVDKIQCIEAKGDVAGSDLQCLLGKPEPSTVPPLVQQLPGSNMQCSVCEMISPYGHFFHRWKDGN